MSPRSAWLPFLPGEISKYLKRQPGLSTTRLTLDDHQAGTTFPPQGSQGLTEFNLAADEWRAVIEECL
jgi:hypothetical protein